jgi:hypothetical protein
MRAALLALALCGAACADDMVRHARFTELHGERGLAIVGEKVKLENGNFEATVVQVKHDQFVMSNVQAHGRMPIDEAFFADVVSAAVGHILHGSTVKIASFRNTREDGLASTPLEEIKLVHAFGALQGEMKASVARPVFKGKSRYDKPSKSLIVTLESVKLGSMSVPMGVAFYTIGKFMKYPFVKLANPNIIIDLKPFLPPPSAR